MSHKKRIKEKLRHNVGKRLVVLMRTFVCCSLYRFARALGFKKRIWSIRLRKYNRFDPDRGHLYKKYKTYKFIGTEDELDNELKKYDDQNMFIAVN